jgi:acyl carrier protein
MAEKTTQVLERMRSFFLSTFPAVKAKNLGIDDSLFDGGVLDSMGMIEVVLFMKSEFGLDVDGSDLRVENFNTIRAVSEFVSSRVGG